MPDTVTHPDRHQHRRSEGNRLFFELRQYLIRPGKKDEWVRLMEDEIIPFQQSQGMVIVGSFTGEEDEKWS